VPRGQARPLFPSLVCCRARVHALTNGRIGGARARKEEREWFWWFCALVSRGVLVGVWLACLMDGWIGCVGVCGCERGARGAFDGVSVTAGDTSDGRRRAGRRGGATPEEKRSLDAASNRARAPQPNHASALTSGLRDHPP
jgi:hypothetical protein